jgi:galactonate dehydratase
MPAQPISNAERYFEPERFLERINKRAVDVLQPDIGHVGSMLEAKKVSWLTCATTGPAPQSDRAVMNAMTIHLAALDSKFSYSSDNCGRRSQAQ